MPLNFEGVMDHTVLRLLTPAECEQFILNVQDQHPELAMQARRRGVELRAAEHGCKTDAEREALSAVYAYQEARSLSEGRRVHASRTWQMIKKHGIIAAVERAVNRSEATMGYDTLVKMGMKDFAFEAVVVRHPDVFSEETIRRSEERLKGWE